MVLYSSVDVMSLLPGLDVIPAEATRAENESPMLLHKTSYRN